jgi:DNA polymerase-3 subunit epsilon
MEKREIIFDTETTGLDSTQERITEIGALEVVNGVLTGSYYHAYLNPKKEIPKRVIEITGLTNEFLKPMRLFSDVSGSFLDFVKDSTIIAHNSDFDMKFINAELKRCGEKTIPEGQFFDTVKMARKIHVGKKVSLDSLCSIYGIDTKERDVHSALIDCMLLFRVYREMSKESLKKIIEKKSFVKPLERVLHKKAPTRPIKLKSLLTTEEKALHVEFIQTIKDKSGKTPQWERIFRKQRQTGS